MTDDRIILGKSGVYQLTATLHPVTRGLDIGDTFTLTSLFPDGRKTARYRVVSRDAFGVFVQWMEWLDLPEAKDGE